MIIRNPNAQMRSELFLNSVLGEDCFGLESSPNPRNDTFYVIWVCMGLREMSLTFYTVIARVIFTPKQSPT